MVKVKTPLSSLEACIIDGIKDVQANNIKFHNIAFDCRTIEDSEGRVFVRKRTGKWVWLNLCTIQCDQCFYKVRIVGVEPDKFCPNCGADMRGEQDE